MYEASGHVLLTTIKSQLFNISHPSDKHIPLCAYLRLKESMMALRPRRGAEEISGKFSDYSSLIRGSVEYEISLLRPQHHH